MIKGSLKLLMDGWGLGRALDVLLIWWLQQG